MMMLLGEYQMFDRMCYILMFHLLSSDYVYMVFLDFGDNDITGTCMYSFSTAGWWINKT